MRVGHLRMVRPDWYDRNPVNNGRSSAGSVTPHLLTTRWSYTVPSGYLAYLDSLQVCWIRTVAPGAVGLAIVVVSQFDGVTGLNIILETTHMSPGVGARTSSEIGQLGAAIAGVLYTCESVDPSTGGTMYLGAFLKVTEFLAAGAF